MLPNLLAPETVEEYYSSYSYFSDIDNALNQSKSIKLKDLLKKLKNKYSSKYNQSIEDLEGAFSALASDNEAWDYEGFAYDFAKDLYKILYDKCLELRVQEQKITPLYYNGEECLKAMIESQGINKVLGFCACNAFKYLYRHQFKNGVEDIKKAKWYIEKYLEIKETQGNEED